MNTTTYGLDIAKNVQQVHWVDPATGEVFRRKLPRSKLLDFFARQQPARVAIEACGGAHHWARSLQSLGHQVELLPPHKVREHVSGNKDDAADARGIWVAAHQKDIRRVPVKSCQQQAEIAVHRVRSHLMSMRTATVNMLRSLMYEFGVVMPKGRQTALTWMGEHRAEVEAKLPPLMLRMLDDQRELLRQLDQHIKATEVELQAVQKANPTAQRLMHVPGIGLLGATAFAATLGDARAWRSAREFACCVGIVPRHTGSGGKVRMGGISKRGDSYLRTLVIHGARNLVRAANPPEWIAKMLLRRPFNVVVVAVAHKLVRIAWAMAARQSEYDPRWQSAAPAAPAAPAAQ